MGKILGGFGKEGVVATLLQFHHNVEEGRHGALVAWEITIKTLQSNVYSNIYCLIFIQTLLRKCLFKHLLPFFKYKFTQFFSNQLLATTFLYLQKIRVIKSEISILYDPEKASIGEVTKPTFLQHVIVPGEDPLVVGLLVVGHVHAEDLFHLGGQGLFHVLLHAAEEVGLQLFVQLLEALLWKIKEKFVE